MGTLSAQERQEVKRFITHNCANYHSTYGCLPYERPCYMLSEGYREGTACKYFKESVMPMSARITSILSPARHYD